MILSQNVWNLRGIYKDGLEAAISVGIEKGQSAATLSKRISKYLNNFDSLRKDYKQKYGVATRIENCEYRAARLARTEINMAYRTAEQNSWRKLDFVLGGGHIITMERTKQGLVFYDPQRNFFISISEIISEMKPNSKLEILRVDRLLINPDLLLSIITDFRKR